MKKQVNAVRPFSNVAKGTVISVLCIITLICTLLLMFPSKSEAMIVDLNGMISSNLGFVYIWLTFLSIIACVALGCSKYGKIKLGEGKKAFSEFSWAAMMFCASMAAGFIYWGSIEWASHYMAPPFGIEPESWLAAEYAATIPIFNWGISAWSLYLIPAVAFAFIHFNKKSEKFDVGNACRPIFGARVDGWLGQVLNVFFILGILGGVGTALGIGSPLVSACLNKLFNIPDTPLLRFIVIIIVSCIFTISAYKGINKGIKILSDINIYLMLGTVIFLFIFGPTTFILKMQTTSIGIMLDEFVRLSTWLDPVGVSAGYPENWTVFYWAWWMSYSIFMGIFVAKISGGRTVRQVIFGGLGYGFLGSFVFFSVFGNYFMGVQLFGSFNILESLQTAGGPATVVEVFSQLPAGTIFVFVILLTSMLSMATNFDSASYTMAMVSSRKIQLGGRPSKTFCVFWAVCIAAIPMIMMLLGGSLTQLQTLSVVMALPTCILYVIICLGCFKMLREYYNTHY
ncbi:BCCT family transporter [Eubacterium barkeri]|uniref:Betaine/carnitine transporter, BCCT family n=1 Tax=Eubacterium barkeri TaxID=1528 RepID=A0A1H3EYL1_EUBBA|nr:BCCT family transporter [Eubacterium barkeri]SDX82994.1 betaine/carnitine transporter, BCCT family [Eubacterium barkeri]